ncbi:MAG: hypothetical protein V4760_09035 [Bdellovibrionota bacterium]
MKNALLVLALSLSTLPALATPDSLFDCKPTPSNGLGIQRLELVVSNEDPQARMKTTYSGGSSTDAWLAYEGHDDEMSFVPETERDGSLSVHLKRVAGKNFEASVTDENIDTFSILQCTKRRNFYIHDMIGSNFRSDSINLMGDDGISSDGFALRLEGTLGKDFTTTITLSNPGQSSCDLKVVDGSGGETLLEVDASLEIDTGDTCTVTIQRGTSKVDLEVYATGT